MDIEYHLELKPARMGDSNMKKYAELREVEDITGLDLKDALMELYEGSAGCAKGMMPVSKIQLPDGAIAQVFVTLTTDRKEFIQ